MLEQIVVQCCRADRAFPPPHTAVSSYKLLARHSTSLYFAHTTLLARHSENPLNSNHFSHQSFCADTFRDAYIPTIEDTYRHMISCNKNICTLQITDTTGSHQFPAMQRLNIQNGHAFMLVYRQVMEIEKNFLFARILDETCKCACLLRQ